MGVRTVCIDSASPGKLELELEPELELQLELEPAGRGALSHARAELRSTGAATTQLTKVLILENL